MCQIRKTSYINGKIIVEVSSAVELVDHMFEIYIFDFKNGCYGDEPNIKQPINSYAQTEQDSGVYTFKFDIPSNCKVKCAVSHGGNIITSREKVVGNSKHKIKISVENSEIGHIYKIKSDISISKKLIFYKAIKSSTKIHIPADIEAGEQLMFIIKDKNFSPRFETYPDFVECFNIEQE